MSNISQFYFCQIQNYYRYYIICNIIAECLICMGNQLLKGYTIHGEPISGVGCEKMWRIYQGLKTSTNTNATIFVIQKKALPRSQRDELILFAKRQAMSLARIRHPGVLAISQALIQDEHVMAFSTEQVYGNLTLLAKQNRLKQIISNQIQLRLNLFPLFDTIQFLHENVKTVHLGINFDNIYITKQGKWKLSGFSNSQIHSGEGVQNLKNFRCSNYYFCAPQVVNQKKFQKKSDVYSLGILILDLLLVLSGKYQPKAYKTDSDYAQNFQSDLLKKINSDVLQKIETYKELKILLKNVFSRDPQKRSQLHQLSSSKWLNDKLVLTVKYLQNITNYDNKQQIQFLKGLLGILNHFEPKILLRKVLPLLLDLLKFKNLIPSVVYICLEIMKNGKIITQADFRQKIWPSFKKVVQGKEMTAHSLYLFVDNMEKIQKVVGVQQLTQCIIPLYIKCFDCPAKLKQLALHKTDYILGKMDYQFVKTKMIPKIMSCIKDPAPQIHKKSLIALRKTIKILDTQTVTSIVLPGLQNCKKSASDQFVNAITVSIYTMLGKSLPSQVLCSKLIPTILPYLSDPNVGPQDFYNYKNSLLTMIQKIQSQRKKFWDDGNITQATTYTEKDFQFEDESKKNVQPQSNIGKGDYNFLSNYNSNQNEPQRNQNPQKIQQQPTQQPKKQPEFNFNSPWNFDDALKTPQNPPTQSQPTIQTNSFKPTNINNYGNFGQIGIHKQYQPFENNRQQIKSSNNNNISTTGSYGGMNSNMNKIEYPNQPISPQTRQNYPKLKGPDANRIKKPQSFNEPASDPWASIQIVETTVNQQNDSNSWNFSNQNKTIQMNNMNFNTPLTTNNSSSLNMGGGSYFGNIGDDPFAVIQKGNTNNFNMSSNMSMNFNLNTPVSPKNTQFGFSDNSFSSFSQQSQPPMQNYSFGNPTPNNNANNFSFNDPFTNNNSYGYNTNTSNNNNNMGINMMNTNTNIDLNKKQNNNSFDLI